MVREKCGNVPTAWEEMILVAFSTTETKYPTRSNLGEESFILVQGMSGFKPPCGEDIAMVALRCWESAVAA